MLRNIGSNWVLILVTIGASYVLTPLIIRTLGRDGYGTWTLMNSMTGYIGLLSLGVPAACVRYLAQHVAEGDSKKINVMIASCAGLYLMIGAAAAIVGGILLALFTAYEIPIVFRADAQLAFGLMVIYVSAGFVGLLPEGIMFAHHDFVRRNLIRMGGIILRLALTTGLLAMHPSLILLALIQIACLAFDFGLSWVLVKRRYPDLRINLADFDLSVVRRILSFSLFVLLLAAGSRLSFETDAVVIGWRLGVGLIPFYVVANSLIVYLMEFVIGIAAVVSPMATTLKTQGKMDELREMFLKWSKVALSLTIMIGLFLIVLGPTFIGWWIEPSYEGPGGAVLQILMASCFAFLPVRGVALPLLIGLGKPKLPTLAFLLAGLLNLVLSVLLAPTFGLIGVAVGTAIPNVLFAALVLPIACRELEITVSHYLAYVVPRAAAGAIPVLALLLWFRNGLHVQGFSGLVMAGFAMVVLFSLTWVLFVYRDDPYVDVMAPLVRLRSWSRA